MIKKIGRQSVKFEHPVTILATASTVGPKEGEGPIAKYFDVILSDMLNGETTWEKAESKIAKDNMTLAIAKANLTAGEIDYMLAGDLLNQSIGTTFGVKDFNIPLFGIYGACSTFGEGLSLGSMLIDGGFATNVLIGASSHFCSAEKQFRFPLELGSQRPLSASWTVTGDGAAILTKDGKGPYITGVTTGKIIDLGVKDVNNMGAAMAPSAADTLLAHFKEFNRTPEYYDVIATGDLGHIGRELVVEMMLKEGYDLSANYTDCGVEIYDRETQDTHAGGSGCGCSAATFSGYYFDKLKKREIKNILLIPTGALLSTTSVQQKENIPGIAHAVCIELDIQKGGV